MKLLILGHRAGVQGEVSFCSKLLELCHANRISAELLDIFDLLPGPDQREQLSSLSVINIDQSYQYSIDTSPFDNPLSIHGHNRLQSLYEDNDRVVLFGTMPYLQIGLVKFGITEQLPTIGWFYPYSVKQDFIYQPYLQHSTLLTTYSPTGIDYLLANGVPKHKIIMIPIPYPQLADLSYCKIQQYGNTEYKKDYLGSVAENMNKTLNIQPSTVVFGLFSRIVPMYNHVFILKQCRELAATGVDFILLIKSPLPINDDYTDDAMTYTQTYLQLRHELYNEPWLLLDEHFASLEELYNCYQAIDISIFMSGAGQAAVEQVALGTPLLLLDIPYNRSLFEQQAYFVDCLAFDEETTIAMPDPNSFQRQVATICTRWPSPGLHRDLIRHLAQERFSGIQVVKRLQLALQACHSYFYHDTEEARYRLRVTELLEQDLTG